MKKISISEEARIAMDAAVIEGLLSQHNYTIRLLLLAELSNKFMKRLPDEQQDVAYKAVTERMAKGLFIR